MRTEADSRLQLLENLEQFEANFVLDVSIHRGLASAAGTPGTQHEARRIERIGQRVFQRQWFAFELRRQ